MGSCFRGRLLRSKNSYDIADPYSDTYSSRESYHRTVGDSNDWQLVYDGSRWTNERVGGASPPPEPAVMNGTVEPPSPVAKVRASPVKESPVNDEVENPADTSCDVETYEGIDLEYEADSVNGTWDSRPNHEAHEEMKQRASLVLEQRASNESVSAAGKQETTTSNTTQIEAGETNGDDRQSETQPLENGVDVASDQDAGEQTTSEVDAGDVHEQTTPEVRQRESWRPVASGEYSVRFDVPDSASGDSGDEERTNNRNSLTNEVEKNDNRANEAQSYH